MAASHSEGVLCLEGYSVRSPGSWQGGSWVSVLLVCVLLDTFACSCSVICCFVFFHGQDQLIRPHTCCGSFLEPTCQSSLLAFVALFALFAVLFAWFVLVLFGLCVFGVVLFCFVLFCFVPIDKCRCSLACAPLLNPQRGIQCKGMRNSFYQHNNVRRPGFQK